MKSDRALRELGITRNRLKDYVKEGTIMVTKLDNGRYDYDDEDILRLSRSLRKVACYLLGDRLNPKYEIVSEYILNSDESNTSVTYYIDKEDETLSFSTMLNSIIYDKNIRKVILYDRDQIPMDFNVFMNLLNRANCSVIVINK